MYYRTPNRNLRFLASMHAVPASSQQLPQWALEAYQWAECLVFESELGPATLPHFMAQDGIPLEHKLSASVYGALRQLWSANGRLPELRTLRPWAAAMLSATAVFPMTAGVEPTFMQWAGESGKELQYLESPSALAGLADRIPVSLVDSSLAEMLADLDAVRDNLLAMHASWFRGDMQAFSQIALNLPLLRFPQIKRAILDLRNEAWASSLQARANVAKKTLVAVGALHLCVRPTAQQCAGIDLQLVE
jgi:uncharacterized protein YbaP (TraB family)